MKLDKKEYSIVLQLINHQLENLKGVNLKGLKKMTGKDYEKYQTKLMIIKKKLEEKEKWKDLNWY